MRIKGDKVLVKKRQKQIDRLRGKGSDDPLLAAANLAMLNVEAHIKGKKLSGTPIHVRTGRLRSSIRGRAKRVKKARAVILGTVGTNVVYAPVLEFGYKKNKLRIKNHWRKQTKAFGKPISPRSTMVKAHTRDVSGFEAKPWLGPGFFEKRRDINRYIALGYRNVFK